MLSRVADSIYWMARYMERAENLARLLLSTQDLLLDAGAEAADESQFWGPLLMATGDEEKYYAAHPLIEGDTVANFLALSTKNGNSILNCVRAARENARTIRDQISDEMWECINSLRLFLESPDAAEMHKTQTAAFYEKVLVTSYQFQGIAACTTPRDESWHFLRLGMCLERADKTSRLIDTCSAISLDMPPSPLAYSSNKLDPVKIIEYLMLDPTFPRSVAWCVEQLHDTLIELSGNGRLDEMKSPVRTSGRLRADIAYITMNEVLKEGLHEYIDRLQEKLNDIGQTIFETFVLYSEALTTENEIPTSAAVIVPGAFHALDGQAVQQQ
jgi:uncharacterized alpha-E superfamily protein